MSGLLLKHAKRQRKAEQKGKAKDLPADERTALARIKTEAKAHGATLHNDGEGGLPPSMVLGVFRKCGWRCVHCKGAENLTIHHIGGIPATPMLSRLGHKTKQANLTCVCTKDHDELHDEARELGVDSTQVTPAGDVGTDRDHGDKPVARG